MSIQLVASSPSWREVVKRGIYIANAIFILYLFILYYLNTQSPVTIHSALHQATLIHTYKIIRSYLYISYLILGLIAAIDLAIVQKKKKKQFTVITALISGLLLTTFAYALTGILVDLIMVITHLLGTNG